MGARLRAILAGTGLGLCSVPAAAGGGRAFPSLLMDPSARFAALGGVGAGEAEGVESFSYNPAGLSSRRGHEAVFTNASYIEDLSFRHMALSFRQGWGFSLTRLSAGGVEMTTLASPGGGSTTGGFEETTFAVGYGRRWGRGVSAGGAVKRAKESMETVSTQATLWDLGARWESPSAAFRLGAALLNAGGSVQYEQTSLPAPSEARFGAVWRPVPRNVEVGMSAEGVKPAGEDAELSLGVEVFPRAWKVLSLRAGYNSGEDAGSGVSMGMGLSWAGGFSFDYAMSPLGDLGTVHRISLLLRWGRRVGEYRPPS